MTLEILDKAKKISILNYNGYNYVQRENSIMNNKDYLKIKKRVKDFIEHNNYHQKTIKNKNILSYSNKATLFKIRELKDKDLDKEIKKINSNKKYFNIKPLSIKEMIFNIYLRHHYNEIIYKKNKEFYEEK